jgi:hypothetical protein
VCGDWIVGLLFILKKARITNCNVRDEEVVLEL